MLETRISLMDTTGHWLTTMVNPFLSKLLENRTKSWSKDSRYVPRVRRLDLFESHFSHFAQQVAWNEKGVGKSGKGVVLQDIHASPAICMSKVPSSPYP